MGEVEADESAGAGHGPGRVGKHASLRLHLIELLDEPRGQRGGLEPTPVEHTAMASVKRWPTPGATLPITVDLADPTRIKIHWDDVQTGKESAMQQAEQMAEMMKGAGTTAQGAGMDLGAAIQQAAGAAGRQAKPAADDAAGQIERFSQLLSLIHI